MVPTRMKMILRYALALATFLALVAAAADGTRTALPSSPPRFNKPVAMLSASICAGMAAAIGRMMGAMTLTPMSRICVPFWRKCGRGP